MLQAIIAVAVAALLLYVAFGLWHSTTLDVVKPRRLRRVWSAEDQAEFNEMVNARQRGDA
jgi:hypothetical protein